LESNFLNYANLSYGELKQDIISRMAQDPRFSNFTESQLYSVLVEIFAATTDFTNYYIGRRAEESFLDSAKLRSSVIMLSKMLGYIVQRPIPATTSIQIKIKTKGVGGSPVLTIPRGTVFTFNGLNFVLKNSITYTLSQTDINNFATNPNYYILLEFSDKTNVGVLKPTEQLSDDQKEPIYLIQGDMVTYDLAPSDNDQLNTRYQTYKISDKTFSNLFGSEDYGYDISTGDIDVTSNFTRVGVHENIIGAFANSSSQTDFNNSGEFYIDRRSFLNEATYDGLSARNSGASSKYCVVRTTMDDSVEVLFADDNIGKIGPKNNQHLFVKYLSTKGASANQIGVAGKLIYSQSTSFGSFNSSDIEFYLRKNITGGSDIETIESMKVNAPGIFYSLDRCVSSKDYVNYLKTLTSPINVKNAIAWGEQEETADKIIPNIKMFNVVLFSILGSMYHKSNTNGVESYDSLAGDEDFYKLLADNNWFELLVAGDSVTPLRDENYESNVTLEDVGLVYEKLKSRSQVTTKNVYIAPIIKDLKIGGYVYLNALADRVKADTKIKNAIYAYLDDNADFDVPVYISNLIELIESFPEVHHADIKLVSNDEYYQDAALNNISSSATSFSDMTSYDTDPVGKIYREVKNERSISSPYYVSSQDIYTSSLSQYLSAYSDTTKQAIILLLPQLETVTFKMDPKENGSQRLVSSEIVWPSNNVWNKKYCRISTPTDSETDLVRNFVPSERNFYLGMMKPVYDRLKKIATSNNSNQVMDYLEGYISNFNNCAGCSMKQLSNLKNKADVDSIFGKDLSPIYNADPLEVSDFLNNKFAEIVDIFRNSFINDLHNGMLDDYSNAVNYTIKNEIVRIKAPELSQYVYYR
jgi:hypothetical protein